MTLYPHEWIFAEPLTYMVIAVVAIHDTKILKEIDSKCKTASENTNVTEIKLAFDMVRVWIKELRECR